MAQQRNDGSRFPVAIAGLTALWLAIAIAASAFTIHLCLATARQGDFELTDSTNQFVRMADAMTDVGATTSDIVTAVSSAAKSRGLDVDVRSLPPGHPPAGMPRPGNGPSGPFMFMTPPDGGMFGMRDPTQPPAMVLRVGDTTILLSLDGDPISKIVSWYFLWMIVIAVAAVASIAYADQRIMRRALAPAATIKSALRRLASGEYTRLEVLGHEPSEVAIVDAYNAAADELAVSIRLRAEAEGNLRTFVADAGHELRTPLTVIMGFVDVLRQGAIAEQAVAQRILDSVASEGERMRLLISKLLLLARLDTIAPERDVHVDLSQVAADVVESFRPIAGATSLRCSGDAGIVVSGSTGDMREVVGILIDNALKYAPGAHVEVAVTKQDRSAVLSVSDDGPGMAPDIQARAFDRFSRGDERGSIPGSGLGLAIVKRIAVRAGGDVELSSSPGKGTRISVRLPLAPA